MIANDGVAVSPAPASALIVLCPVCQAGPGAKCTTADGAVRPPHDERLKLAAVARDCPTCGAGPLDPCRTIDGQIRLFLHSARR